MSGDSITAEDLEILLPARAGAPDRWLWATVTAASPLRIRLDGDASELPITPDSLARHLVVDDRVLVAILSRRLTVIGRALGEARVPPGDNLVINGRFRTNQRGAVSGATIALNAYFFDRWIALNNSAAYTWTTGVQGQALTLGTAGNARAIRQTIERANIDPGYHTLSWEGGALGRVYNVGASAPSYAAGPITVSLDGSADVRVEFQGSGATVDRVKLERGILATPFVLETLADELDACRRYFRRYAPEGSNGYFINTAANTTSTHYGGLHFQTPMRAAPTMTPSSSAALFILYQGVSTTSTTITAQYPTKDGCRIEVVCSGSVTAGYSSWCEIRPGYYIDFSAEL